MSKDISNLSSNLIFNKEDFKNRIEERIKEGKKLLTYEVIVNRTEFNKYILSGYRTVYDKTSEQEFLSLYSKWKKYNIELLKRSFDIPENEYVSEYKDNISKNFSLIEEVDGSKIDIKNQITFLESIIGRLELIPTKEERKTSNKMGTINTNKIFIVHGHNNQIKSEVARVLEKLNLDPIILHEQADNGMTIIEKFEQHSNDVNFAIILLTADDFGNVKTEENTKPRARQNVIFEMGYFYAKLGRKNVFLLKENEVENPSDLSGIIYTPYDEQGAWKMKLVKHLRETGYKVSGDDILDNF